MKAKDDAIPNDWQFKSIREIGAIKTGPFGTLLKAAEYSSLDGVPLISVGEIGPGYFKVTETTPRVPARVVRRLPQYVLKTGDIVFGRKGAVDRSALVSEAQNGWFLGSDGISIRPSERCHPPYLACQFQRPRVQQWLLQNATGTTMASLNQRVLSQVTIPYAPTSEQRVIADVLADADMLLVNLHALIAKKRDVKQATMQQLLTGERRLPGFEGAWRTTCLGDVVERFVGGGTPSRSSPNYWGGAIPWVTVKDFATFTPVATQEYITPEGLKSSASKLIPKGTIIISTRMALGRAVVYDVDVSINQDLKAVFPKVACHSQFLRHWFAFRAPTIEKLGSGSTVMGLSLGDLKGIPLDLPTLPEQVAISHVLAELDSEIVAVEARWNKTWALKQGMMAALLTGRIRLI